MPARTPTQRGKKERKYDPYEIADEYLLRAKTVWEMFVGEPGVIRIQHPTRKRQPYTLRIPESVVLRVFEKLTVKEKE